jgi:putative Mn2+ efflux pump MntP
MTDKWGRRFFKSGGVFLILLGLVHSLSFFEKLVPANDRERQLLDLMSSYKFNLMGSLRSMDNLLQGFGVTFMLAALGMGALTLAVSNERTSLLKRVALVIAIWLAVMTGVSLHYFFAAPTSFLVAALLLFVLAWLRLPADDVPVTKQGA